MRYTLLWRPIAERQLIDLWSNFPAERSDLTRAVDEVERLLRDDPSVKGRPFGVSRVLIKPPIIVLFSVDEGDKKVKIMWIKRL
jgi:hypothetical protein